MLALILRLCLIATAKWVLEFWPLQLAAAGYLLWLSGKQLLPAWWNSHTPWAESPPIGKVVLTLALTDLAFSLDSIAAAVAVTDRLLIVMTGGVIGVLSLRLTAGLFTRWLEIFPKLETAGYVAVGLVGARLLLRLLAPQLTPPEWLLLLSVVALLGWGFSTRQSLLQAEAEVNP
jgi:predicted tellurium resistance membrane protein TerC